MFRSSLVAAIAALMVLAGAGVASADADPTFAAVPAPTITGTAAVGQTLSASFDASAVVPEADSAFLTWFVGDTNVGNGDSLGLHPEDLGKVITVQLTVLKAGYTNGTAMSESTAAVALGTQSFTPVISGAAAIGSTLKVTGLADGATSTYQWKRNGVSISAARAATYKVTSTDLGKTISVTITATRAGYTTLSKTSAPTAAVKKAFSKSYAPRITGTAKVGSTLKATTTAWSPIASLKYQWYRDGVAISGATSTTRKLSSSDEGKKITVKVTGSKTGYYTLTKTSTATTVVGKGAISAATPKITGTAKAGSTLKVTPATPTPSTATKTYQWYRNGIEVVGATSTSFVLHNVDAGKKITVKVTYTLTGYTTKSVTSAATATIAARSSSLANNTEYTPNGSNDGYPAMTPGIYIANATSDACYWVRDTDHDPDNGQIVEYGGIARWMVEVYDTDGAFYSIGCGSWIKYDGTGALATTITKDGMYSIGVDIKPGQYQQSGAIDSCYVTLEANASNEDSAILADDAPALGDIITIDDAVAPYFTTWRCGTWTWVGDVPEVG